MAAIEPIISAEQYEKAQQRIKAEYTPKYAKPPELHRHWLSGMVKCHTCGCSLSTSIHKDKRYGRTYTNFQCYGYLKGKCSVSHQISVRKLEPAVLEGLKEIMEGVRPLQFKIIKSEEPTAQSTHEILTERLHDIEKKKNGSGRLTGMALTP
ncbi:MAG: zinc ribbon domain-containing protein [Roseburia sp.]